MVGPSSKIKISLVLISSSKIKISMVGPNKVCKHPNAILILYSTYATPTRNYEINAT